MFVKYQRLTSKIERMIIADIRRQKPGKYMAYKILGSLARLSLLTFVSTVATYVITVLVVTHAGQKVDQSFAQPFVYVMLVTCAIWLASDITRNTLHKELEVMILKKWSVTSIH